MISMKMIFYYVSTWIGILCESAKFICAVRNEIGRLILCVDRKEFGILAIRCKLIMQNVKRNVAL